jgi:cation transport regulator
MPYGSIDELPDTVKQVPEHGKEIFRAAFNSAYDSTCKDRGDNREQCAFSIAWSAVKQKYEQDKEGKWTAKKESETKSIIQSITIEKPKIDNGTWIAFLKAGQLAEDSNGKKYRITRKAIEDGYLSFKDGYININHQDKIRGKIADVKLDNEFAYAKLDGIDQEALDVINSIAYKGVSQQSQNIEAIPCDDGLTDVLKLKGNGLAIALYPKQPGCNLDHGCGIPVNIGVETTSTMDQDYTKDNILEMIRNMKSMLRYMKKHPGLMDDELKKMLDEFESDELESILNIFSLYSTKDIISNHDPSKGGNDLKMTDTESKSVGSIEPETKGTTIDKVSDEIVSTLKSQVDALIKENAELKSTIQKTRDDFPAMLKSALEAHDAQIKAAQEFDKVKSELYSITTKESADKILATNPTLDMLKSTVSVLAEMKTQIQKPTVGAVNGETQSTVTDDDNGLTVGGYLAFGGK